MKEANMRTRCLGVGVVAIALAALVGLTLLAQPVAPLGIIVEPPVGLTARVWVDQPAYTVGSHVTIHFEVNQDAYVYIWDVDPTGAVCLIYPNAYELANHVAAGTHVLPGAGQAYALPVTEPTGSEYLQIVATTTSVDSIVLYFGGFTPGSPFSCSPAGRLAASQMESVKAQIVAAVAATNRAFNFTGFQVTSGAVPSYGTLTVMSSPSGALVALDGYLLGYTPLTQPVLAGSHTIALSKTGYRDWTGSVVVAAGATTTVSRTLVPIGANQPPIASFSYSPPSPTVGAFVTFDGSASSDPDGTVVSYAWTFGDGGTGVGATSLHQYAMAGTYTATLTVTDNLGATGTTSRIIQVSAVNQSPVALFLYSPANPTPGAVVTFNAAASYDPDGTIASYAWTFGDGWSGWGMVASHPYASAGTYTVTLTVTDNVGAPAVATQTVQVTVANVPPVALFTYSPASPLVGQSITLNASGSYDPDGLVTSYAWDLDGNGVNDASGPIVSVRYYSAGSRTVRLTVTDNGGLSTSVTQTILVGTGGGLPGAPAMDGTPGIFVWGTDTWHITVNAGSTWTSSHSYRIELHTDGSFLNVNQSTGGGVSPLGIVPTPIDSGRTLLFEGSLVPAGVSPLGIIPTPSTNASIDFSFTLSSSSTYIRMSLKLDLDGNGTLDEAPGFVYLRSHMVHPTTAPFVVGLGYGGIGPLVPSTDFWVGYCLELGPWGFPMYQARISSLEGY